MRITHRLCQEELASLADEIEKLEEANETLADQVADLETENADLVDQNSDLTNDLDAAEHGWSEIIAACRDLDYAATDAVIPTELRDRLMQLAALTEREPEPEVEFLTA
ncbi:hypothetical protein ACFWZ7_24955 [Nocardiopsis alba]|uniref:hypothetical protein n=1 Tax=Nocardiopsis alba TaxID=53437 RepID=UPI00366B13F0